MKVIIKTEINQGRFIPNEFSTPGEELYDKNKKKLDGTYKRIVADSPKDDVYDRFNKMEHIEDFNLIYRVLMDMIKIKIN